MAKVLLVAIALSLALCAIVASVDARSPPVWPQTYYATAIFSIPYFNTTEPIVANFDAANNRQRFDYYSGLNSFIFDYGNNVSYSSYPQVDKMVCAQAQGGGQLVNILPDLTNWTYVGNAKINGWIAENWELITTNYGTEGVYNFFLYRASESAPALPLLFVMKGVDTVFDSHPDIYIIEYNAFTANWTSPNAFAAPALCNQASNAHVTANVNGKMNLLARMFKPVQQKHQHESDEAARVGKLFEEHCVKYNKYYKHDAIEHKKRMNIFADNLRFIEAHNRRNTGTVLEMNHFGDLSDAEFKALYLPKNTRTSRPQVTTNSAAIHAKMDFELGSLSTATLPDSVDWVKAGKVTMVKDQGACGSCWTFGTTGTVEGHYAIQKGRLISLSEQQIVDCAWGFNWGGSGGNQGCNGGFASGALQWIINNGGISTEALYPYIMQDGFCLAQDKSSGVRISGYVNVSSSEDALQVAVAKGPTAVAIDASHPEFRFYRSGVYFQPDCKNDADDLDHEVLAVGYGKEGDRDYWLVKNSWSTHWGDKGYVKMSRNRDNNCGIATQANYPLI